MGEQDWLAARFEENRSRLKAVAWRMLGSVSEAEDAVQEAWLRFSRSDTGAVENLGGWLTTVVSRVCLDMLRARRSRREEPLEAETGGPGDPERDALLADSVGFALVVVLDKLAPAERVAFVLHDMFGVPFDEIAPIVGRSHAAARQLASRARRRVRGADAGSGADPVRRREVVAAFFAASRAGDFEALLALLDPDVILRADAMAVSMGASPSVRGARAVAETFKGRARAARVALIDGAAGAIWAVRGRPRVAFAFTVSGGRVAAIELIAEPARLSRLRIEALEG